MTCPLCNDAVSGLFLDRAEGRFHPGCDELWSEGHRTFPAIPSDEMPCDDDACPGTYCGSAWRAVECSKPCCGGAAGPAVATERERATQARETARSDRRWRE